MNKCLVCRHQNARHFCTKHGQQYLQCDDCGHVFIAAVLPAHELHDLYATRKSHHDDDAKIRWDFSDLKDELVYQPLLESLSMFAAKGMLLDIGCSTGSFVMSAQRHGWQAFGMELEQNAIDVAKSYGLRIFTKDLVAQSLPSDTYSAVTLWQVLEHLENPKQIIFEIKRILKPGGVLAISTPNVNSIGWLLLKDAWDAVEPTVHLNLFNLRGVKRLFGSCGFRLGYIETVDVKPATLKKFVSKFFHKRGRHRHHSVAEFADRQSDLRMRRLLRIRKLANIPLMWLNLGEDIYAYFKK